MTTIVMGETVDVEVVLPPTLVVSVEIPPTPTVIVLYPETITVTVEPPSTPVISIPALPGPRGPSAYDVAVSEGFIGDEEAWLASLVGSDGSPGVHGGAFVFTQAAPSVLWDIYHNLDYTPNILVVDSSGAVLIGDVEIISPTHLKAMFSVPISGAAYLS